MGWLVKAVQWLLLVLKKVPPKVWEIIVKALAEAIVVLVRARKQPRQGDEGGREAA